VASFRQSAGEQDHGQLLLEALRDIFGAIEAMLSAEICSQLNENDELPFAGFRKEKGIDARGLANILRPYDIRPKNVGVPFTGQGKGYERSQFEEAWTRYARADEAADDPSRYPSHENGSDKGDPTLWDAGTDGTDEAQPSLRGRVEEDYS
jgi:hypothetical protein